MKLVIGKNGQRRVPVVKKEVEKLPPLGRLYRSVSGRMFPGLVNETLDFSQFTRIQDYGCLLANAYRDCTGITSVDMSTIQYVSGDNQFVNTFYGCYNLLTVDMSSVLDISGASILSGMFMDCSSLHTARFDSLARTNGTGCCTSMFSGCVSLANVNFDSLQTVQGSFQLAFRNCTSLTAMPLKNIKYVSTSNTFSQCFYGCTGLTAATFYLLNSITNNSVLTRCFEGCVNLTSLSFPSLTPNSFGTRTNQFNSMLSGCTGVTVRFPSNIQATIGSWSDVTNGFGGTNTTVLFDLPAAVTLSGNNSVNYIRNPEYDTSSVLGWYNESNGNSVPYYTSGTSNPTVGTTIYLDSSCTTSVTTVASIA